MKEVLPNTFSFRVTSRESEVILAAANELQVTPSVYLRSLFAARHAKGPRIVHPMCGQQWQSLSRMSSNLNEIAHALNRGESIEYQDLLNGIEATLTELKAVRLHLSGGAK